MSESRVRRFGEAAAAHGATWSRTTPDAFEEALADAVVEPAVGVELNAEGVSLAETPVTVDPTPAELDAAATGVTPAALGVADYGSVVVEGTADGAEPVSLFPERHVAVLAAEDVVPDVAAAFERLGEAFRGGRDDAVLATGPSATADMGSLVYGAHGPREAHVVVVEGDP